MRAHASTPSCTVRLSPGCVLHARGLLASLGCSRSTHIYTQSASKLCCTDCRARCSYCVFMPLSLVVLYGTFMHVACAACAPFRPAGVHTACCAVLHCTLMHGTKACAQQTPRGSPSLPPWPSPLCWACLRGPRHQRDLSESAYVAGPEPPAAVNCVHTLGRAVGRGLWCGSAACGVVGRVQSNQYGRTL